VLQRLAEAPTIAELRAVLRTLRDQGQLAQLGSLADVAPGLGGELGPAAGGQQQHAEQEQPGHPDRQHRGQQEGQQEPVVAGGAAWGGMATAQLPLGALQMHGCLADQAGPGQRAQPGASKRPAEHGQHGCGQPGKRMAAGGWAAGPAQQPRWEQPPVKVEAEQEQQQQQHGAGATFLDGGSSDEDEVVLVEERLPPPARPAAATATAAAAAPAAPGVSGFAAAGGACAAADGDALAHGGSFLPRLLAVCRSEAARAAGLTPAAAAAFSVAYSGWFSAAQKAEAAQCLGPLLAEGEWEAVRVFMEGMAKACGL
jgi:hypothetical protein